ncbi:MAG: hypothetical protein M1511_19970 [Deltaproteobacteria bacterium]|nr:hypothetical protein [Deltaproteobacteria bacterium]
MTQEQAGTPVATINTGRGKPSPLHKYSFVFGPLPRSNIREPVASPWGDGSFVGPLLEANLTQLFLIACLFDLP